MDEDAILSQLAPTLRRELEMHLLASSVERLPLFNEFHSYVTINMQLEVSLLRFLQRSASTMYT